MQKEVSREYSVSNETSIPHPCPQSSRDHQRRWRNGKEKHKDPVLTEICCETTSSEHSRELHSETHRSSGCLHKLKMLRITGWTSEGLTTAEELLTLDQCWGRETPSSSEVWHQVGWPCSSRWLHTSAHLSNTDSCSRWVIKKRTRD